MPNAAIFLRAQTRFILVQFKYIHIQGNNNNIAFNSFMQKLSEFFIMQSFEVKTETISNLTFSLLTKNTIQVFAVEITGLDENKQLIYVIPRQG